MEANTNFRILIIDDNPAIHQDFIKILKTNSSAELDDLAKEVLGESPDKKTSLPNFEIDTASQGQEGVKRIAEALDQGNQTTAFVDIPCHGAGRHRNNQTHLEVDKDIR